MAIKSVSEVTVYGVSSRVVRLILLAVFFASAQGVFRVASFDDLRRIGRDAAYPLSGDYELICDIDASASRVRPFEPIGGGGAPFTGRFYGRGGAVYVIRNLYISKPSAGHVGLFGVLGREAEVFDVGVEADTVRGSFAVGTLAGSNKGRIVNCYGTGAVAAARRESDAGGLVGVNGGVIYGSWSAADVYGADNVGGLAGLFLGSPGAEIAQCFALGAAVGGANVGGLVGQVFGGRVRESFSAGRVTGSGAAGGLIGTDFVSSLSWSDRGVFEVDWETVYVSAAEVSGSYWDIDASGRRVSAGGEGRGGELMRRRETFAGWDFGGVWAIESGVGYPQLARVPYKTRKLVYVSGDEGCGRLSIVSEDGAAELYAYAASAASGAEGPEVTAAAWNGCRFAGWSDGYTEARRTDFASRDTAVFVARFEPAGPQPARVYRYEAAYGGDLRVSGVSGLAAAVDTAVYGAGSFAVAAAPRGGYRFSRWSDGEEAVVRSDGASAAAHFMESGSNVIEVSRYGDLYLIGRYAAYPLYGSYELTGDIEIPAGGRFEPIGSAGAPFTGSFRGNGRVISGLDLVRGGDNAGLFGYAAGADIRGVFVEGSVTGLDNVGLLAGMCVNTVIDSCGARGSVRGRSGVGGLVGRAAGSLISRSRSFASVDGSGGEVGGLAGGTWNSFLAQSCASGAVSGVSYVGGAAGWGIGGWAQDCFAAGDAAGERGVGGFIGRIGGGMGVSRGYSAGPVLGGGAAGTGGFAGMLSGAGYGAVDRAASMTGCYWDAERSLKSVSAGGVGAGTAEMRRKETYAGWDFENIWIIDGGYPQLRGLEADPLAELFFERRREPASASASAAPLVRAAGRTVYVNAGPGEPVTVRLIDMRGKTVARREAVGAEKLRMDGVASGRYILEARRRGKREFAAPMRIFK